jgi:hypothetical protein
VVEHRWLSRLRQAALKVHHLDPANFMLLDATAGYWVSERAARVQDVREVDDCLTVMGQRDVEVRLAASLWPYVDAVVAAGGEFSAIRMRNAHPRQTPDDSVRDAGLGPDPGWP